MRETFEASDGTSFRYNLENMADIFICHGELWVSVPGIALQEFANHLLALREPHPTYEEHCAGKCGADCHWCAAGLEWSVTQDAIRERRYPYIPTQLEITMRVKHHCEECGWGCPECAKEAA